MRMRLKARRGEKHKTITGSIVTFLEVTSTDKKMCKVLTDIGVVVIAKADLVLPVIETQDYEKIGADNYAGD